MEKISKFKGLIPYTAEEIDGAKKEINVILEMQYLPEEYRARLVGYLRCLRDDMKK